MKKCALCGETINTGSTYCSRSCSKKAYWNGKKKLSAPNVVSSKDVFIPQKVRDMVYHHFGDEPEIEAQVLTDMVDILRLGEDDLPRAAPTKSNTVGGYPYETAHLSLGDYRPDGDLSFDRIDMMLQCGQVLFATNLKKAPIRTVFRNEKSWSLECKDDKISDRIKRNMANIFPVAIDDMLTFFEYGSAFGEAVYRNMQLRELGLDGGGVFTGLDKINFCYPRTIHKINRTTDGRFDGFQQRMSGLSLIKGGRAYLDVPVEQALVLTYDKKFRNLWGHSYFRAMYAYWYWYEVVWRCFLRFLERQGTPVVLIKAPQRGNVQRADGTQVHTIDHAINVGADIAKSNVAVVPSDSYPDTTSPMWSVDYLASDPGRSSLFIGALEVLGTAILRAGLLADRVATQESATGSYNIASVHYIMTRLDDERILDHLIAQLNQYLISRLVWFNSGPNAPVCRLKTEGLDIEEKQRLFQLIMKLMDAKHPQVQRIDVLKALEVENVPVMSEEEYEKFRKQQLEESKEKMEQQQDIMGGGAPFPPKAGPPQPGGFPPKPQVPNQPVAQPKTGRQAALDELSSYEQALAAGAIMSVLVTPDEVERMQALGIGLVEVEDAS